MQQVASIDRRHGIQLARASDEHDAALAEFFRATWNENATVETVRDGRRSAAAANPAFPGEEVPNFILMQGEKIVGFVGTIPMRIWSDAKEYPAHWIKGFWVLPEFRNGPVGFLVLREAVRNLSCAMALTVLPVVVGLSVRLGFTDLGALPNLVRILNPAKLLHRIRLDEVGFGNMPEWLRASAAFLQRTGVASAAGVCADRIARMAVGLSGRFPRSLALYTDVPEIQDLDALWLRTRGTLGASLVRDGRYLSWRYQRQDAHKYRFITARKGAELAGLAVLRNPRADGDPRLHGATVATISEWIFPLDEPLAGLAALAGAERAARELGADALLCSASHPLALRLLRRRAFLPAPPNVHLLTRALPNTCSLSGAQSDWWITRGDANADEVF